MLSNDERRDNAEGLMGADDTQELTTTRHGRFKTKYGKRVPLCECCGYSIMDKRYNFCPRCGAKIIQQFVEVFKKEQA